MIIRKLVDLEPKLSERNLLPRIGYKKARIGYIVELDRTGTAVAVVDLSGERTEREVPDVMEGARANRIDGNLLWDNSEYALGLARKADDPKTVLRVAKFAERIAELPADVRKDAGVKAVQRFLAQHDPKAFMRKYGRTIKDLTLNVAFRLRGTLALVSDCAVLQAHLATVQSDNPVVTCSVTGEAGPSALLHPFFRGIPGGNTTGAALISFNTASSSFYGREQGDNVPITVKTAQSYGRALDYLLSNRSYRFRVNDNVFVAWGDTPTLALSPLADFLGKTPDIDDESEAAEVVASADQPRAVYRSSQMGIAPKPLTGDYHILGLTGVQARIAISFWQEGRLADLVAALDKWSRDLELVGRRAASFSSGYTMNNMLYALAVKRGKKKKLDYQGVSGRQQAELLHAALNGAPIPPRFAAAALARLRVSGYADDEHTLTALLKLYLNRNHGKEIPMCLDEERNDPGYLLGRSFAVIEYAQKAHLRPGEKGPNVTVRDKFWSLASTTPRAGFPQLDRLFQVYVKRAKERGGWLMYEMQQIMARITDRPARLNLEQQSAFAIGYWHQRAKFYTSKEDRENSENSTDGK